ncbi:cyclase family protein [Syntrophobotulus glycolicus DSM 8271]|uniref:Cyclase family protein n=1 Tax=Syntrophobotulus glycolicus (strain DSM 8271 / FlGlyR) TaxID=645991 RepID=F0T0D9_SYNGF|nr:cyclase family protein [Syntrophobotulus glycolicus]ADY57311.1 cyclase family protein [Syntrophobotulus glycolicus DSM 8271]
MEVVDLSHPIREDMPVFPGEEQPKIEIVADMEHCGYHEKRFLLNSHTGTHLDVPKHVFQDGYSLEKYPVKKYIGQAIMITLIDSGRIEIEELAPYENALRDCDFMLVNTGWSRHWGSAQYYGDPPYFSREAADWLSSFELKGIGIDSPSVDQMSDQGLPVHRALLEKEIVIIENMTNFDQLKKPVFTLYCLPLNIEGADACPVRAVAVY